MVKNSLPALRDTFPLFRGVKKTGARGCFDKFSRIQNEFLSSMAALVVTVREGMMTNSMPANRNTSPAGTPLVNVRVFDFMGDIISLKPTCGFYVAMNSGYAGRGLPRKLRALFRPCAMIRPNLKRICGNMLLPEGSHKDDQESAGDTDEASGSSGSDAEARNNHRGN
eukprot:jgi/Undpi1/3250/HiC_scaffold_15.g06624.m1